MPSVLAPAGAPDEMTINEAVAAGYASDSTIRRKIKSGELVFSVVDRTYVIPRDALEQLRLHTRAVATADPVDVLIRLIADAGPTLTPVQVRELRAMVDGLGR